MKGKETKHVRAFLDSQLESGETFIATLEGWIGKVMGQGDETQHNGNLILTSRRAAFYRKGLFGHVFQTMPVEKITSIETRSFLNYRILTIHTSHDELSFKTFESAELFSDLHNRLEDLRTPPRQQPRSPSPNDMAPYDGPSERLERLRTLHVSGVISDEEYLSQRQRIISEL